MRKLNFYLFLLLTLFLSELNLFMPNTYAQFDEPYTMKNYEENKKRLEQMHQDQNQFNQVENQENQQQDHDNGETEEDQQESNPPKILEDIKFENVNSNFNRFNRILGYPEDDTQVIQVDGKKYFISIYINRIKNDKSGSLDHFFPLGNKGTKAYIALWDSINKKNYLRKFYQIDLCRFDYYYESCQDDAFNDDIFEIDESLVNNNEEKNYKEDTFRSTYFIPPMGYGLNLLPITDEGIIKLTIDVDSFQDIGGVIEPEELNVLNLSFDGSHFYTKKYEKMTYNSVAYEQAENADADENLVNNIFTRNYPYQTRMTEYLRKDDGSTLDTPEIHYRHLISVPNSGDSIFPSVFEYKNKFYTIYANEDQSSLKINLKGNFENQMPCFYIVDGRGDNQTNKYQCLKYKTDNQNNFIFERNKLIDDLLDLNYFSEKYLKIQFVDLNKIEIIDDKKVPIFDLKQTMNSTIYPYFPVDEITSHFVK